MYCRLLEAFLLQFGPCECGLSSPWHVSCLSWGMSSILPCETVSAIGFLADLSSDERQELLSAGVSFSIDTDETVIEQGQQQQTLYLVLKGALRARCHSDLSVVDIGVLVEGDCFGEMSLLDPLKASATIKATEPGILLTIDGPSFQRYVSERPHAGIKLLTYFGVQLTRRMRKADDQLLRSNQRPVGFDYDY